MPELSANGYRLELLPISDIGCHELARWHFAEWQALYPEDTVGTFAADLRRCRVDGGLPLTWVLQDEAGRLAGSISLLESDLDIVPTLTPWLANLWVHPRLRQRGIGSHLLQHACEIAWQRGEVSLYLYTTDRVAFYQRHGWTILRESSVNRVPISIMVLQHDRALLGPFGVRSGT